MIYTIEKKKEKQAPQGCMLLHNSDLRSVEELIQPDCFCGNDHRQQSAGHLRSWPPSYKDEWLGIMQQAGPQTLPEYIGTKFEVFVK